MATASMPALPLEVRLTERLAQGLFALAGITLVGAAAAWAVRGAQFPLRAVQVDGDLQRNSVSTIRANAMPRLAGNFFSIDLARSRAAFESVPWVRRAEVRRQFPHTLRVRLEEHRAVAYWGNDADGRLLNQHGEIFEANVGEVEQEGLPRLVGPASQAAQVLAMYRLVRSALERL